MVHEYVKRKYIPLFTNGSKDSRNDHFGEGVYIPEFDLTICKRINEKLSVYTAKVVAIILGLQWVEKVNPQTIIICYDSAM